MISQQELFARIQARYPGQFCWVGVFPYLYGEVTSPEFDLDQPDHEAELAAALDLSVPALRALCTRLFLRLEGRHPDEASSLPTPGPSTTDLRGAFWINRLLQPPGTPPQPRSPDYKVVHFYGFKGGQGRSTTLALFARSLAEQGWRVLTLDLDAEAPSLNLLFDLPDPPPEHSLVGVRAGADPAPLRVLPGSGGGYVDLLAFAPLSAEFIADSAALALELALYPPSQSDLLQRLAPSFLNYDVVLVDHRTGLAPTVQPWVQAFPGAICSFARMDGQWRPALPALHSLWPLALPLQIALLSMAPHGRSPSDHKKLFLGDAAQLLEGAAPLTDDQSDEDIAAGHYQVFPYDQALVEGRLADSALLTGGTLNCLATLRSLFFLEGAPPRRAPPRLTPPSVAGDLRSGLSVETRALQLLLAENDIDWVVGRKGTGKTWLVRTLHQRGRAEALLVPDTAGDPDSFGVPARDGSVVKATQDPKAARHFWLSLFVAGLQHPTSDRAALVAAFETALALPDPHSRLDQLCQTAPSRPRHLLIDGLELAFSDDCSVAYISELLRLVHMLRSTERYRSALRIQVFVRPDLLDRPGRENLEQLTAGRRLDLVWDRQTALNLLLGTILLDPWFGKHFPKATEKLRSLDSRLRHADLGAGECIDLLSLFFADQSGFANQRTRGFWTRYFTDDPNEESGFFPRLLLSFVQQLGQQAALFPATHFEAAPAEADPSISDGHRIAPALIAAAHNAATRGDFLRGTLTELGHMLPDSLRDRTDALADALIGRPTPVDSSELAEHFVGTLRISPEDAARSLDCMERLGVFERHPRNPSQLRCSRLYRTALQMKFRR